MPVPASASSSLSPGKNVANLTDAPRLGRIQGGAPGIKEPGQGNPSRPRVAHREFLSGRAGWTWCATQLQVTRMIPPPQNRAGYAIRRCLSSRWYACAPPGDTHGAHPGIAHFRLLLSLEAPAGGAIRKCQSDTGTGSRKHRRNVEPGALRSCASHRRHAGFSPRRPSRPGRALSSGAAGTAAVTPGQAAASAATAQRAAAPRIRLQATGSPLRPGMR